MVEVWLSSERGAQGLTGHKTEAVYRRYAIVCEADLSEGLKKLARVHDTASPSEFSHSLAAILGQKVQIPREIMAEGARFELADELPHLRFSRPARSTAPSPLRTTRARCRLP